jgi:hypothetical protein
MYTFKREFSVEIKPTLNDLLLRHSRFPFANIYLNKSNFNPLLIQTRISSTNF